MHATIGVCVVILMFLIWALPGFLERPSRLFGAATITCYMALASAIEAYCWLALAIALLFLASCVFVEMKWSSLSRIPKKFQFDCGDLCYVSGTSDVPLKSFSKKEMSLFLIRDPFVLIFRTALIRPS